MCASIQPQTPRTEPLLPELRNATAPPRAPDSFRTNSMTRDFGAQATIVCHTKTILDIPQGHRQFYKFQLRLSKAAHELKHDDLAARLDYFTEIFSVYKLGSWGRVASLAIRSLTATNRSMKKASPSEFDLRRDHFCRDGGPITYRTLVTASHRNTS